MFRKLGVWLIAGALVVEASPARANGAEIGFDAGGIVPLRSRDIQLVSERVEVPVSGGQVRCQYVLRNLASTPVRITMGFVTNPPLTREGAAYSIRYGGARLQVSCHGASVPIRVEPLVGERWTAFVPSPPDSLPVWEVSFGPSEEVPLVISYWASPSGGCDGRDCGSSMTYHAAAAGLWAGLVDSASIRFTFSHADSVRTAMRGNTSHLRVAVAPEGFIRDGETIRWDLRDWEPEQDFTVSLHWLQGK